MQPVRTSVLYTSINLLLLLLALPVPGRATPPLANETQKTLVPTRADLEGVVWAEGESVAVFLPEIILNSRPLSDLPLSTEDRKDLEELLARQNPEPTPKRHDDPCFTFDSHSGMGQAREDAESLTSYVRTSDVAFTGRITAARPGWNAAYSRVVTMVDVEIDEVLRSKEGWPVPRSHVLYEQATRDIHIQGHLICQHPASGLETFRAVPGQRVLVAGRGRIYDPPVVYGGVAWEVTESGDVLPQPYTFVEHAKVNLRALRASVAKGE
jgi:hypothetical protein